MRRALLLAAVLCGALAPAAHAGTPFTIGEGRSPHLVVDGAGTAHVVWNNEASQILYCQVPRDATACAAPPVVLDTGLEYGADATYLVQAGGGTLHWVMPHYVHGATYAWTSTDNGATWGPRTKLYDFGGGTDSTEPFLGPQAGQMTFAAWNTSPTAWDAALDGGQAAADARATFSGGGGYDLALAPTGDGGIVGVTNDLSNAAFFRMGPGGDPSEPSAWSGANPIGPGKDTRVAGGPGGAYLLATVPDAGGGAHMELRRWTGSGFSAPFSIPEYGYINDVSVAPSGTVAAIYRVNASPANRLRMATSTDGGASYALATIALDDVVMADMDVALAPDGRGWATYTGGPGSSGARAQIRVVETTPVDEAGADGSGGGADGMVSPDPPSILRRTANVGGARLQLDVPGGCVPLAGRFSARLSVRRFPRRGTFVNVRRADFLLGKRRVKRDRKAPFVQTITIRNPVAGRAYTLRTRAFIKRKRKRRLQRKVLRAPIRICGQS